MKMVNEIEISLNPHQKKYGLIIYLLKELTEDSNFPFSAYDKVVVTSTKKHLIVSAVRDGNKDKVVEIVKAAE